MISRRVPPAPGMQAALSEARSEGGSTTLQRCDLITALASMVLLTACAGFRGGWESVPYIGDAPPPELVGAVSNTPPHMRTPLGFAGLKLRVSLDNQLRTYDNKIYFGVPLSVDPRNVSTDNNVPGRTRVRIAVTPEDSTLVFRPELAVLTIDGLQLQPIGGVDTDFWDAHGQRVKEGGKLESRAVVGELQLDLAGYTYYLAIDFPAPAPSPETAQISVDLGRALASPRHPELPLIRFAPVRWKEGYQ